MGHQIEQLKEEITVKDQVSQRQQQRLIENSGRDGYGGNKSD